MNPVLLDQDIGFWEVIWYMIIIYFWMMVIWMFIAVFADIFRRHDHSGLAKAGWCLVIFVIPFFGLLIYMIARPKDATRQQDMEAMAVQAHASGYSSSEEIAKAQQLLQAGTITQAEFDVMKARALA